MGQHKFSPIFFLIHLFICCSAQDNYIIKKTSESCQNTEYFSVATLECSECTVNSTFNGYLCKCKTGYKKLNSLSTLCEPCLPSQIVSKDGWECLGCPSSSSNNPNDCGTFCSENTEASLYYEFSGKSRNDLVCQNCATSSIYSSSSETCVSCPDEIVFLNDVYSQTGCSCDNAFRLEDGVCFEESAVSSIRVDPQINGVISPLLSSSLKRAYLSCVNYYNTISCELLGNMCVLSLYDDSRSGSACELYKEAVRENGKDNSGQDINEWPTNMPWLYYDANPGRSSDGNSYTINSKLSTSYLKIVAAKYSADGEFLGYVDVYKTTEILLCKDDKTRLQKFFLFGKYYDKTCSMALSDLVNGYTTYFYDLYSEYTDDSGNVKLQAMQIVVTNYGNSQVRRMFLVDNISGRENNEVKRITYLSQMQMTVYANELTNGASYVPTITLTYQTVDISQADTIVTTRIYSIYEMKYSLIKRTAGIFLALLAVITIIISIVRAQNWRKRSGTANVNAFVLFKLLIFVCGGLGHTAITVSLSIYIYIFVMWKFQDVAFIFLPTASHKINMVDICFQLALILKIVDYIHLIFCQVITDVFFVDFERPKNVLNENSNIPEKDKQGVPMWRTYFVANEWNELQTIRKVNLFVHLLIVVFILKAMNVESYAEQDSNTELFPDDTFERSPPRTILRLAVGGLVYGAVEILLYAFEIYVYSKFKEDVFNNFVDLCTACNISLVIMMNSLYGFYIHGRSVHGFAEADMQDMFEMREKEISGLTGQRGLTPESFSHPDCQVFEMVVPEKLRQKYVEIRPNSMRIRAANVPSPRTGGSGDVPNVELLPEHWEIVKNYNKLNDHFVNFINLNLPNCGYAVEKKSFIEKVLHMEFEDRKDSGIFYIDDGHQFDECMLYGNEFSLFMFDLILFLTVDYFFANFITAAVVVYVVQLVIIYLRNSLGKANIAKKALVDERFLI